MTIKVEREALLRVLSRQPVLPQSFRRDSQRSNDGEFVVLDLPKPFLNDDCYVKSIQLSTCDDDRSLCTLSTDSLSTDSGDTIERRVSFSPTLVTEEWSRPRTPREEVSNLFYSTEETQRFRQDYRLERKLLSELSIDPDTRPVDDEELSSIIATSAPSSQSTGRHRISRVVVLHNDKLETFFQPNSILPAAQEEESGEVFDNDSFWSGSLTWY